jgi:hypothetical protein
MQDGAQMAEIGLRRRGAAAETSSGEHPAAPCALWLRAVGSQDERSRLECAAVDQGRQIRIQESGSEDTGSG